MYRRHVEMVIVAQVPAQVVGGRKKLAAPLACDDTHVNIVPLPRLPNQTLREGLLALFHGGFRVSREQSTGTTRGRQTVRDETVTERFVQARCALR